MQYFVVVAKEPIASVLRYALASNWRALPSPGKFAVRVNVWITHGDIPVDGGAGE